MFLEYHQFAKHQCFYIPSKIPHAYIKGECFEIMKNSDNVIRLGLTPKLKDLKVIPHLLKPIFSEVSEVPHNNYHYSCEGLNFQIIFDNCAFKVETHEICIVLEGKFVVESCFK